MIIIIICFFLFQQQQQNQRRENGVCENSLHTITQFNLIVPVIIITNPKNECFTLIETALMT